MRLLAAWLGNNGKPVANRTGERRYQVRWRIDPGNRRRPIERKRTDFLLKGEAQVFLERLRHAEYGTGDWVFDHDGQPVPASHNAVTVLDSLCEYVATNWSTVWQSSQRTKVRGRLLELLAITVARPADRATLLDALAKQTNSRGRRPEPSTTIEWAARWLRDVALYPAPQRPDNQTAAEAARLEAGRRWLAAESLSVAALDVAGVTRIRLHFTEGRCHSTARTYWQGTIVPWFNWLEETEAVDRRMTAGQPKLKRDVASERPDPRDIPTPLELRAIAASMGAQRRPRDQRRWSLFVLLAGFCALRISEALAVRLNSFERVDGRWWLVLDRQIVRSVAASSDDGSTTLSETDLKSTRDNTPPDRRIPIPPSVADRLVVDYGDLLGVSNEYLFVGPRGGVAQASTVRDWWHDAVVDALGVDHRLAAITPHVLRHAGMTYWFAAGIDHRRIQLWGGWSSLKEMLDTYRGLLTASEIPDLSALDALADGAEESLSD